MQDQQKSLTVRERSYGDYIGYRALSRQAVRKSFYCSLAGLAVFLLSFLFVPYLSAEANAAVDVNFDVDWTAISLTFDPDVAATQAGGSISDSDHGNIEFGTIVPTGKESGTASAATGNVGTLKILRKTLGIESTGKYYTVYLSTVTDNNSLNLSGDSTTGIEPVSSSFSSPAVFSKSSWGFAVPGVESTGLPDAPTYAAASLYSSNLDNEITFSSGENVYKSTTWSAVPDLNNPLQIWKAETANLHGFGGEHGDTDLDTFDIFYAVMVGTDVLAGVYSNQVVYTVLASSQSLDAVSTNLSRSNTYGTSGITETLAFDVAESVGSNLIQSSDVTVYLVKHADMVAADYDPSELAEQTNVCAITNFSIDDTKAALTCTIPTISEIADSYADASTAEGTAGRYDFWIHIEKYGIDYVSKVSDGTREAFAYVGLQSRYKDASDGNALKNYVTYMQDVTTAICANTNLWGKTSGASAQIYDPTGTTALSEVPVGTDLVGVASFELKDKRDEHPYLIRRIYTNSSTKSCYMAQDLDLDLSAFAGTDNLNNTNTDLYSKTSWDPAAKALAIAQEYDPTVTLEDYFPVFAQNHIQVGSTQTVQFQPTGTFYSWRSKFDTEGNELTSWTNNANVEIARSYDYGDFHFYNWYAATAESGTYAKTSGNASDTICPRRWTLPSDWYYILATAYDANHDNYTKSLDIPLSRLSIGYTSTGGISTTNPRNWTKQAANASSAKAGQKNSNQDLEKPYGSTVRCVLR